MVNVLFRLNTPPAYGTSIRVQRTRSPHEGAGGGACSPLEKSRQVRSKVPPHTTLPSGDGKGQLTPKVVWDKLGAKLNATICFVMALNHQSCVCVCPQKMAHP